MDPAELAAGVPAADRDLRAGPCVADPDLDPGADRIEVRRRLVEAGPRASGPSAPAARRVAGADVPPQLHVRLAGTTWTRSSSPSRLRSTSAAPRPGRTSTMPAPRRPLDERAVGLADQQVARVLQRVVGLALDVALAHEQVDEAVVVDVLELRVPGGRGERRRRRRTAGARVTPRASAMSSYVGVAGPSSSVWSLLSPWLVR